MWNSHTGEPIRNAVITMTEFSAPKLRAGQASLKIPAPTAVFSGLAGEFLFPGLSPGTYRLTTAKPGFTAEADPGAPPGSVIELKASVSGVRLLLSPRSVIEGQIVDQNGDPAARVNVVAISRAVKEGLLVTQSHRTVDTDDQGKYRIWNLSPGKYYVKAAGRSGGTFSYVGDSASLTDSWESFAPVYAGGASDIDSATAIAIGPGEQGQANIRITRQPAFKIRGILANFTQHQTVEFELLRGKEQVTASRTTLNEGTGRFDILNVIPGSYLLRATQNKNARAETMVTVGNGDLNNVSLSLSPAVNIPVIMHPIDKTTNTDSVQVTRGDNTSCQVTLGPSAPNSGGISSFGPHAEHDEVIEGVIEGVLPGAYRVRVKCYAGYLRAMATGNIDLLTNPTFMVVPGIAPAPIELTVQQGGGALIVKLVLNPMPKNAGILLLPTAGVESREPTMQPAGIQLGSQLDLQFMFGLLAPGDYAAYAFSEYQDVEFRNPTFIQSLSGGTSVHIYNNQETKITLSRLAK